MGGVAPDVGAQLRFLGDPEAQERAAAVRHMGDPEPGDRLGHLLDPAAIEGDPAAGPDQRRDRPHVVVLPAPLAPRMVVDAAPPARSIQNSAWVAP